MCMCMFIVRLEYKENVDIQLKTETKVRTFSTHYVSDVNKAITHSHGSARVF